MSRISHWTPRYVVDRVRYALHERRHPELPWISQEAARHIDTLLKPDDKGFEFGSGRSTVWYAARLAHLTSVEDHAEWAAQVSKTLKQSGVTNVAYVPVSKSGVIDADVASYIAPIQACADASLDFVMVDGAYRGHCALAALDKLSAGGLLVIDNVERYLPSTSRAPVARSQSDGPAPDEHWPQVWDVVRHWRMIWTSSGVTDTAIFFKP